jgi:glycosyltransferase involved in cell wall biosynthesis
VDFQFKRRVKINICVFIRIVEEHGVGGGMERQNRLLCEGLARLGHEVHVITTGRPEGLEFLRKGDVAYHFLKGTPPGRYTTLFWQRSADKFHELHQDVNFDLVCSQSLGGFGYYKFRNKERDVPYVVILHGTTVSDLHTIWRGVRERPAFIEIAKFLYRLGRIVRYYLLCWRGFLSQASKIIAVSQEIAETAMREYGPDRGKVVTIPNGVDMDVFKVSGEKRNYIRERYEIEETEVLLLVAGRVEADKGMHLAVKALPEIVKKRENVKLMIVGKGSYYPNLTKIVSRLSLSHKVILCGYVNNDEMPVYINACDIFLNPTIRFEGFPLIIPEVMACGKPIIASRIGGIPSAIEDGRDGILVEPGNVKSLVDKVIELIDDKSLADKLSGNARRRAEMDFSQERIVEQYLDVFDTCLRA